MKAVRLRAYDGPLALEDVPAPTIADDEILVKTRGTAVNHLDRTSGASAAFSPEGRGGGAAGPAARQAVAEEGAGGGAVADAVRLRSVIGLLSITERINEPCPIRCAPAKNCPA
jgi:hypothetical protein